MLKNPEIPEGREIRMECGKCGKCGNVEMEFGNGM
jgi:hypothetical protein